MQKLKNNKAITLIALVITIVVLIIIAGITINITISNNGVLNKAKETQMLYKKAQYYEEIRIEILEEQLVRNIEEKPDEFFIESIKYRLFGKNQESQENVSTAYTRKTWVKNVEMCDENSIEHVNSQTDSVGLNNILLVQTIEDYEIIIRVDNDNNKASIVDNSFEPKQEPYTITYNANRGQGSVESQSIRRGLKVKLQSGSTLSREGYLFAGWGETADATADSAIQPGDIKEITGDKTYYAIWSVGTVTITYMPGVNEGYSGTMEPSTPTTESQMNLIPNAFSRTGYEFTNWIDNQGNTYTNQQRITATRNMTLTAQWREIEVESISLSSSSKTMLNGNSDTLTVTYNPNSALTKSVTWSTTNSSIVSVNNGIITANAVGSATITATTPNGKNATCTVTVQAPVAKGSNDVYYDSIQSAIDGLTNGTVTLLTNLTTTQSISVASGKTIILDMNSKSVVPAANSSAFSVSGAGNLTIKNGTANITKNNSSYWPNAIAVNNTGTVTLQNMTCNSTGNITVTKGGSGTLNIESGTYQPNGSWCCIQCYGASDHGTINITGGTIGGQIQYDEGANGTINVSGGTITSSRGQWGYGLISAGSKSTQISINITGGSFSTKGFAVGVEPSGCTTTITGGTFNTAEIAYLLSGNLRWRPSALSGTYSQPYIKSGSATVTVI